MNKLMAGILTALSLVVLALAAAPPSLAADKFFVPDLAPGEEAVITALPDHRAGEFKRQEIEVLAGGTVSCSEIELSGALSTRVAKAVTFPSVELRDCSYMAIPARVEADSCAISIHGRGTATLEDSDGSCDLTVESAGCTLRLGKGQFATFGFNNNGLPEEITAQSESVALEGTATGVLCLAPGPEALGLFSGYLRFGASIDGAETKFEVIL